MIIIIINEEIIVAFSPKTTRTRYKVKVHVGITRWNECADRLNSVVISELNFRPIRAYVPTGTSNSAVSVIIIATSK